MKHSLLAATAAASVLALGFGAAQAADLTYEPPPVAPPPFSWAGFYAGVHAGYAWGSEDDNQSNLFGNPPEDSDGPVADSFDVDGFIGGVHAGYNWQAGQFVFGVEGDIDYSNIKGSEGYAGYVPNLGSYVDGNLELKSQWQASARLRAGYAVDNFLLYATGGIAFADGKLSSNGYYDDRSGDSFGSDDTNTHVGWTIGAGAEYAFTPNWIGRAELRYTDFGSKTYQLLEGPVDASWTQTAVTLGVSYKF